MRALEALTALCLIRTMKEQQSQRRPRVVIDELVDARQKGEQFSFRRCLRSPRLRVHEILVDTANADGRGIDDQRRWGGHAPPHGARPSSEFEVTISRVMPQ